MEIKKDNKNVIISFIIVIGLIILIFIGVMNKPVQEVDEISNTVGDLPQEEIINNNEGADTSSLSKDTNNMDTQIAKNGDTLVMNYTGRLEDGTVFDSNIDPKFNHVQPFEFILGAGMVIAGWDEGLVGMKIGEKKTLTITPDKGYGDRAIGSIPANSTLIFDVELVGIK